DRGGGSHRALVARVVALGSSRMIAVLIPGMWLWGIALLRFASPLAWATAASVFLTLIPAVDARLGRLLGRIGDHLVRSRTLVALLAGVMVAATTLVLPDRSHFVGDFLLRYGPLSKGELNVGLFPQALPLDLWFHFRLPTALAPFLH